MSQRIKHNVKILFYHLKITDEYKYNLNNVDIVDQILSVPFSNTCIQK